MIHPHRPDNRSIIIVAIFMGIAIGALVIVALVRSPVNAGVLPNQFGPCTYFVQKQNGIYTVTPQVAIGGLIAGQQVSSTSGQDFGGFFQPFVNNIQAIGSGNICLSAGEYDVTTGQSCNMTANGQTCGLLMRAQIFYICPGYQREAFGNPAASTADVSCVIKYTGTTTITCLICYGQFQSTLEWDGGGMFNVGVDGNGNSPAIVNDCVEAFNIQDFRFYQGFAVNCISNDIRVGGQEAGGVSNIHITDNLFGMQASQTTGVCVNLDFGTGQAWVQGNFFAAQCFGYNILANGGGNGFGNKIFGNQIEACAKGTGGQVKAGTCIYDLDTYDTIQLNTIFNGVDYDCTYGSANGQFISGNLCQGQINQQNNADGSCFATDNAVNTNSFTKITANSCVGTGGGNHLNACVRLNGNAIANTHNITITDNSCSGWQAGGVPISLTGTFDGNTLLVSNNAGNTKSSQTGAFVITCSTSPCTYTNSDGYIELLSTFSNTGGITSITCAGSSGWAIGQACIISPGQSYSVSFTTPIPSFSKEFVNP